MLYINLALSFHLSAENFQMWFEKKKKRYFDKTAFPLYLLKNGELLDYAVTPITCTIFSQEILMYV